MNTDVLVLLLILKEMAYYFWRVTWMKNVNIFQIFIKIQPHCVA